MELDQTLERVHPSASGDDQRATGWCGGCSRGTLAVLAWSPAIPPPPSLPRPPWHHAYADSGGDRALANTTRHSSLTPAPTWHSRGATIASTGPWRVIRCSPRIRSPLVPRSSPALRCSPSLSPPTHRCVVGGRGHALAKDRFSQGTPARHGVDRRTGETGSIPALNITDSATAPDADGRGGGTSDSRTAHSQIKRGGASQTRAQCILRSGRRPGGRAPAMEGTGCHARQSPPRSPIHDTHVARRAARPPPRSPIHRDTHHSVGVRSPPRSPARHDAHTARHTRGSPPSSPTRHITHHTVGI